MKALARAPASCGELIQGTINGKEMLISYPINMYSIATATFSKGRKSIYSKPKVLMALKEFEKNIGRFDLIEDIDVTIDSNIPVGKGMASSTADMMAALSAVAHMIDYPIDEDMIADTLVKVEPTDSTVFKELTLFEYKTGKSKELLGQVPKVNVLVLEGFGEVDTVSFNKNKKITKSIDKLYKPLRLSLRKNDLKLLGRLAKESALNNQDILYKPYLQQLIELSEKHNAIGVNIAHSGTVCGIIYDDFFDKEKFQWNIQKLCFVEKIHNVQTVPGGYELL